MFLKSFAVLSLVVSSFAATISDCDPTSIFRPTELVATPTYPVPDQPFYLTNIFDNTGSEVNGGTVYTTVSINGLPYSDTKPLCEDTQCPIVPGINNRSTESLWPQLIGKITSTIKWTGAGGESLLCLQMTVKTLNYEALTLYELPPHHTNSDSQRTYLRGNY